MIEWYLKRDPYYKWLLEQEFHCNIYKEGCWLEREWYGSWYNEDGDINVRKESISLINNYTKERFILTGLKVRLFARVLRRRHLNSKKEEVRNKKKRCDELLDKLVQKD